MVRWSSILSGGRAPQDIGGGGLSPPLTKLRRRKPEPARIFLRPQLTRKDGQSLSVDLLYHADTCSVPALRGDGGRRQLSAQSRARSRRGRRPLLDLTARRSFCPAARGDQEKLRATAHHRGTYDATTQSGSIGLLRFTTQDPGPASAYRTPGSDAGQAGQEILQDAAARKLAARLNSYAGPVRGPRRRRRSATAKWESWPIGSRFSSGAAPGNQRRWDAANKQSDGTRRRMRVELGRRRRRADRPLSGRDQRFHGSSVRKDHRDLTRGSSACVRIRCLQTQGSEQADCPNQGGPQVVLPVRFWLPLISSRYP